MAVFLLLVTLFIRLQFQSVVSLDFGIAKSSETYGPFILEVPFSKVCKGPKVRNCTIPYMSIDKTPKGDYVYRGNVTYLEDSELSEVKMKMLSVKGNKKSIVLKYNIKKPCQHFMMSKIIDEYFHATNCIIKKGYYTLSLKYSEMIENFFGRSFFYGEYEFKALTMAKNGNILCFTNSIIFKKPAV